MYQESYLTLVQNDRYKCLFQLVSIGLESICLALRIESTDSKYSIELALNHSTTHLSNKLHYSVEDCKVTLYLALNLDKLRMQIEKTSGYVYSNMGKNYFTL